MPYETKHHSGKTLRRMFSSWHHLSSASIQTYRRSECLRADVCRSGCHVMTGQKVFCRPRHVSGIAGSTLHPAPFPKEAERRGPLSPNCIFATLLQPTPECAWRNARALTESRGEIAGAAKPDLLGNVLHAHARIRQ
jgi:hypothetical protein